MSVLRILALGDAHFQVSNIQEVNFFLQRLKEWIENHGSDVDVFIILGDSLHDHARLHIAPLNKAIEYVKLLASYGPTFVLVGNHDSGNNSIFLSTDHWANCLKGHANVTVVDTVHVATIKGHRIVLSPYVPDGRLVEALNTRKGEWEDARCIFGHQTISGAKGADGNVIIAKDAEKWPEGFPMLVSGHIHGSHWLGPNMYYTGSILQVSVDEDPNKHVALVSIAPGTGLPKIEEISLGLPCKKILHLDYKELEDDFKMPSEPNTKYMLYISCSFEEFRVFKRSTLYKSLLKLPQLQSGAKGIKHKPTKAEVKNAVKRIEDLRGRHLKRFDDILEEAVAQDADPYLTSFHETMMAGEDDEVEDLSELLEEVLVIKPKAASAAEEKEDENA